MSTQRERVTLLQRRLDTTETARRAAARAGNHKLASDLANINREFVIDAQPHDLRSLVTIWLLDRGKAADPTRDQP